MANIFPSTQTTYSPFTLKGTWDIATEYNAFDITSYSGTSYVCLVDNDGNQPDTSPSYWLVLATKGDTGEQGIQGIKGDTGAVGDLVWRGAWNSSESYAQADAVTHSGNTWYALMANTASEPTLVNTDWQLIAAKGDKGDKGDTGDAGLNWQGEWNETTNYIVNDVVSWNGTSYVCIINNTNQLPTTDRWEVLASRGTNVITYRSTWDSVTDYEADDVVEYNNMLYLCLIDNTNHHPLNTTYWTEFFSINGLGGGLNTVVQTSHNLIDINTINLVDTSILSITMTLPAFPNNGDRVIFIDVSGNANTNNITLSRNGKLIDNLEANYTIDIDKSSIELIYYNGNWVIKSIDDVEFNPDTKENALGNPNTDGKVLSSTASGTRSWIAIPADAVISVNSKTGVVVLDADDLSDTSTTNKFVTAAEKTILSNTSGTNTGDEVAATTTTAGISARATDEETLAGTATDKTITPSNLSAAFANNYNLVGDVYGMEWHKSTSTFTRLYDTVGKSSGSDFNAFEPWGSIRRCNLSDEGEVLAYYGDADFKYDGTNGQVMVEIPKFYYKTERTADGAIFLVSPRQHAGFKVHPAFVRNGVEISHIYPSAFEGYYNSTDGTIDSIANVVPSTSDGVSDGGLSPITAYPTATIVGCRGYAQARGTGWELYDFHTHNALCYLMFVEYATFDSQTAVGQGVVNKAGGTHNNANITGETTTLGNSSGFTGTNGLSGVSYRGVENMWGNIWKFVDGININDHVPWVADHDFASDKFESPYASLNITLPSAHGDGADAVINDYHDSGFLTSEIGASATTGLYDYYYQAAGNRIALLGGDWANAASAGALFWALYFGSGSADGSFGARSLYIPSI